MGGFNARDGGGEMAPQFCVRSWNMIAGDLGVRARLGYREYFTGLGNAGSDTEVREVFYYHASASASDKVFATTARGIYDVTTSRAGWAASTAYVIGDVVVNDDGKVYTCDQDGTSASSGGPTGTAANTADGTTRWDYTSTTKKLAFSTTTGNAGRGVFCAFITAAGHFLAYADEVNGLHMYTESTTTWAAVAMGGGAAEISAVDPATFCFVGIWKHRLFFIVKDSGSVWYLTAGTVYGAATQLSVAFAAKFKHGGGLRALYNWTLDGGSGIDDMLVFIGDGGDVAIYAGTDPAAAATFALKGTYYTGGIPAGRHIASDLGGDLLLLTKSGLRPLSNLVGGGPAEYLTDTISPWFNKLMLDYSGNLGWSIHIHPEESALAITVPVGTGIATEQVVMSLNNKSWWPYRDLPIFSAGAGGGKLYFGTTDGRICINDGYVDNLDISDPESYSPVQWSLITSFQNLGTPHQKQVHLIRPYVHSDDATPEYGFAARYDFQLTEASEADGSTPGENEWDGAETDWDDAVWGGEYGVSKRVGGATGMGTHVAIAIRGEAVGRTVLSGFDVSFELGGFL
jgi:hypothetical protein